MSRFAIYFVPDGKFGRVGAEWLGNDLRAAQPQGSPCVLNEWVAEPQKYGFHATIKAPFHLAEGNQSSDLGEALRKICAETAPMAVSLTLDLSRPMAALRPRVTPPALHRLEARIVTGLDRFRAPPSAAELARRGRRRLDHRGRALLAAWGYPYCLDRFDFHLTLTSPLPAPERPVAHKALRKRFDGILTAPIVLRSLSLCAEDEAGRFRQICNAPFMAETLHAGNPEAGPR